MLGKTEKMLEWGGMKKDTICLTISGFTLTVGILGIRPFSLQMAWTAIVLRGLPIILKAAVGLAKEFDIKAGILVSIALIVSIIIGEDFTAREVAFIMQLGALLGDMTVARAGERIEKPVHLTPRATRRIAGSGGQESVEVQGIPREQIVPVERILVGDLPRILSGEIIPVDDVILLEQTSVNQTVMIGESLPVDKRAGNEVSNGTISQFDSLDMRVARVGEDSSLWRMVHLVRSADAEKAKIVGTTGHQATWIVIIALAVAMVTWLATREVIRAITTLVVLCPYTPILTMPTATVAAIGNATKHGLLVREGNTLERLASISNLTFNKTGTLADGEPGVVAIHSFREAVPEYALYRYTASAEQRSKHLLGKATIHSYRISHENETPQPEQFQMLPDYGVATLVDGQAAIVGNQELPSK